eukprot:1872164-Amphidinium_carterae.1
MHTSLRLCTEGDTMRQSYTAQKYGANAFRGGTRTYFRRVFSNMLKRFQSAPSDHITKQHRLDRPAQGQL